MKSAEDFYTEHCTTPIREFDKTLFSGKDVKKAMIAFARKAIEEDRINVAEHAKIDFIPYDEEAWDEPQISIKREEIVDFYKDEEDRDWGFQQMKERDGFEIEINKDSIINAPQITLE